MNLLKSYLMAVFCILITTAVAQPPANNANEPATRLTPEQIEFSKQRDLYRQIVKAADAPTFGGARVMLDKVEPGQITDPELASFFDISKKIVVFCEEVGIPRSAEISYRDVIKHLDYAYLVKRFTETGVAHAVELAAHLVSQAVRIKKEIPLYEKLASTLAIRYEKDSP